MFSKKQNGIIILEKNAFYFYGSNILNTLLRFDFPQEVIRDLEIIDNLKANELIKSFITNNKINPANLLIILSPSILFEKSFLPMDHDKLENEIQNFLNNIPFENISSRSFNLEKNHRVIATNKSFIDIVKNSFETKGFIVESTAPYFFLKPSLNSTINLDLARTIFKNFDSLKQENYSIHDQRLETNHSEGINGSILNSRENKKTFVLIALFLFLIFVLIFLLVKDNLLKPKPTAQNISSNPPSSQQLTTIIPSPTFTPTPTFGSENEIKNATFSAGLNKETRIKILNASGVARLEEALVNKLEKLEFSNIETENIKTTNSEKTLVIFLNTVDDNTRKIITEETKKIFPNIAVQQTINSESDCLIVIGKSI